MTQDEIAQVMQDTAGNSWGDEAHFQRFAALVFEQGKQEGMKQERALWTLTKLGQEIEAQPEQKDAARYQHIKGMARAMSLDISGNHYWHMLLGAIRGPNLDEAIDRAIKAEGQA